jgi:peptidoglycan hydrolase-like protein with peptidoglycan-binding domain
MTNGITKMADGSDVPIGSVVHTLNGAFMKLSSGSVAVTPTAVVSQNGTVATGYISKADNLTYMLGGTRPEVGSAVVTANGNYTMTTSGGSKLPTTVTETLSKGSSGNAVVALQVELNVKTNAGLALDGKFGSQTQAAVIAYQASNGLVQDGRVGPQTSAALGFGYVAPVTKTTNAIISSPNIPSTVIPSIQANGVIRAEANTDAWKPTAINSIHMTADEAAKAFALTYHKRSLYERQEYAATIDRNASGQYYYTGVTNSSMFAADPNNMTNAERNRFIVDYTDNSVGHIHTHWELVPSDATLREEYRMNFSREDYQGTDYRTQFMYLVNSDGDIYYSHQQENGCPSTGEKIFSIK